MANPEIDEFARILVREVRDAAIRSDDTTLSEKHVIAERWKRAASSGSPEAFANVLIPDVVDSAVFYLLHAVDDGRMKLSFTGSSGKTIDLTTAGLGELAGWYMGSGGWREKYATERFVDDFSDLA